MRFKLVLYYCFLSFLLGFLLPRQSMAQAAERAFHAAANQFLAGNTTAALQTVERGLQTSPQDAKLRALEEELRKKKEQEQQRQNQQQKQEQKEQEKQQQDSKAEEKKQDEQEGEKSEEEKKEEEKRSEEQQEEEQQEGEKPSEEQMRERLKEMEISPEKAQMILEAMKSNEIQYLQQMRRQSERRCDDGKPDW